MWARLRRYTAFRLVWFAAALIPTVLLDVCVSLAGSSVSAAAALLLLIWVFFGAPALAGFLTRSWWSLLLTPLFPSAYFGTYLLIVPVGREFHAESLMVLEVVLPLTVGFTLLVAAIGVLVGQGPPSRLDR
jgi:hypothetical protein